MTDGRPDATKDSYYCVEYSNNPEKEKEIHARYFETKSEAIVFCRKIVHRYICLWISTYAEYQNTSGKWQPGWVYFWWSKPTDWGDISDPGQGYPEGRQYLAAYRPPISN